MVRVLYFGLILVFLLFFSTSPFCFAQSEVSGLGIVALNSKTNTFKITKKKNKKNSAKRKVQKAIKSAIVKAKKLLKKVPAEQKAAVKAMIASLNQTKKEAKNLKGNAASVKEIIQQTKIVKKTITTVLGKIKKRDDSLNLEEELEDLEDQIDDVVEEVETGGGDSGGGETVAVALKELPTIEEVFTTNSDNFPSNIASLPNLEGLESAFTTQQLFFESESNFSAQANNLTLTGNSSCQSFVTQTSTSDDGAIAGYDACRSVSAFSGPVTDAARATYDYCVASLAITKETLGSGVTSTSGSVKPAKLYTTTGLVQLNLSDGRTIFVKVGAGSFTPEGNVFGTLTSTSTIYSCAQGATTSEHVSYISASTTGVDFLFSGTYDSDTMVGKLSFGITQDEDSSYVPSGATIVGILKNPGGNYLHNNYLRFNPSGSSSFLQALLRSTSLEGNAGSESRTGVGEFYLTGYDRLRVDGVSSRSAYVTGESTNIGPVTSAYKFGRLSYVVDSAKGSLYDSFTTDDTLYTSLSGAPFATTVLDSSSIASAQLNCTPEESVVAAFSVDLTAEAVQDAIVSCNDTPVSADFCSNDSSIVSAGLIYSQNCND